jgi:hypothetical protein
MKKPANEINDAEPGSPLPTMKEYDHGKAEEKIC